MQLALRRGYGFAGLGEDTFGIDPAGFTDVATGIVTSNDPAVSYSALIAQGVNPIDAAQYDPLGACAVDPNCSMPTGTSTIIPYGTPGGQMTGGLPTPAQLAAGNASSFSPAQIAAALKAGTLVAAAVSTPGRAACPSGVAYPNGQCLPMASKSFGSGAPLIAGVSNTTLGIAVLVIFGLMMMSKKR